MRDDRLMTFKGFLEAFLTQHQERPDRPFCFILGAGASKQSRIPAGAELAGQWLKAMHLNDNFENLSLEKWATPERLDIPGFDLKSVAHFYPELYDLRFGDHPEEGYAFLEHQMDSKEPTETMGA